MRLLVKNIGLISSGNVEVNGLTVIAGANDSGKSTIGKALFSIVKSDNLSKTVLIGDKTTQLSKYMRSLYDRVGIQRLTNGILSKALPITVEDCVRLLLSLEDAVSLDAFFNSVIEGIDTLGITPREKALCVLDLKNAREACSDKPRQSEFKSRFAYMMETEFNNRLTTIGEEASQMLFYMDEKTKPTISVNVADNKFIEANLTYGDGDTLADVTYVESPLYMHMLRTIVGSSHLYGSKNMVKYEYYLPAHILDLAEKINTAGFESTSVEMFKVDETMQGRFIFDQNTNMLVFNRGKYNFPVVNVASGLKSFGIIQLLLQNGSLAPNKLLVWDEPENHLHPEWQINFAEMLIQMSASGFPILITTHSPYFLQAIRFYSARYKMEEFVKYYHTVDSGPNKHKLLEDVTTNLNDVFISLAEPLNSVMNVDLERQN